MSQPRDQEEIKRYLETNENENTIIQNLWETGKFTVLQAYLKKQEKAQMNTLTLHLMDLEKQQQKQTKPKVNRRKEIIKISAEINEIESKKMIKTINESKSWFFEKINNIEKPLTRLIKEKKDPNK